VSRAPGSGRRPAPAVAAALLALWAPAIAAAAGGRDFEDGWLLEPSALTWLTGASAPPASLWATAGQAHLYGMPELPLQLLGCGWRRGAWRAAWAWQRLGGTGWRDERVRLRLLVGPWRPGGVVAGFTAGWDGVNGLGLEPAGRPSLALEARWPARPWLELAASWPLTPPPPWHGGRGWRRWWCLSGQARGWAWSLVCDRADRGAPALGAEAACRLAGGVGWGLRADPAVGVVGLVTYWRHGGALLRTSHLAHPELGVTHRWSVGFGPAEAIP